MKNKKTQPKKYFVYVDESGQDTEGDIFVVSVLVSGCNRDTLGEELYAIEQESKKRHMKWNKSKHVYRVKYIESLELSQFLQDAIFVNTFHNSKDYIDLTVSATAKAILYKTYKEEYRASVFVDGLKGEERNKFRRGLRALHIHTRKVRGVKKDENDAFIRLVDCGLMRDAHGDRSEWAVEMVAKLKKKGIIKEI